MSPTAADYHGPPELTVHGMLTDWHADPVLLAALALATAGYVVAVIGIRRSGHSWPARRSIAFAATITGIVVVTQSFIGRYADILFWVRTVQLTSLFMIVPMFLTLVRPLSLTALLLSPDQAARARGALRSRPMRILAHPASGMVLFMVLPWVIFFTGWLEAMLRHPAVDLATNVFLIAAGFIYYWSRLQFDPVPTRFSPVLSLFIGFAEVLLNAVLGLCLIYAMGAGIARDYFTDIGRPWGMPMSVDEQMGGGAYWILGHAIGAPYLVIVLLQARRHDKKTAAKIDAIIDAHAAAQATTSTSPDPERMRPWWETDPAVAHLGLNTPEHRN